MREIKFRGKCLHGDEHWIYGSLQQPKDGGMLIFPPEAPDSYDNYLINPETVGQFTGVYDANWEEIYEGDILREIATDRKVVVIYDAPQFCFEDNEFGYGFLNLPENFVVIGNIHDNPELQIIMSKSLLIERYGMDKNREG